MYLRAVLIRHLLDKEVLIALMPRDVVAQARHYGLAVLFFLVVGLRMVCSSCQVYGTKTFAHRAEEELACRLWSVVGQQEHCHPIKNSLVLQEQVRDVGRLGL